MKTLVIRGTSKKSDKAEFALRVSSGFNQGALVPLTRKKSILGRSFRACVPLEDDRVSREHAAIVCDGGKFYVEDMGSTNGTYLNNEMVDGRMEVKPGDTIRIGSSIFKFETMKSRSLEVKQKWNNATSVIPRTTFHFDDLAKIKPDKLLAAKRQFRLAYKTFLHLERMFLRELQFVAVKSELFLTKFLRKSFKKMSTIKLAKLLRH